MRKAYFSGTGSVDTPTMALATLEIGEVNQGPAIVETPFTTIVIDPQASFWHGASGSLLINP